MVAFAENQEVPVMVEDIRAAAQRIAANCREFRPQEAACPVNCPGLTACGREQLRPVLGRKATPPGEGSSQVMELPWFPEKPAELKRAPFLV